MNTPQITSLSPTSGAPGTNITITGSGFGSVQGSGTLLLGSMAGVVQSWSNTQVIASVATGSLTGIVRIQQNGYSSNAVAFTVSASGGGGGDARPRTVSGGSTVTLVPNVISMVVGNTHAIEALNASGQSVTGLTWTSTNPSIVSLSTADPPQPHRPRRWTCNDHRGDGRNGRHGARRPRCRSAPCCGPTPATDRESLILFQQCQAQPA